MIRVLFFASLREQLDQRELTLDDPPSDVGDLLALLSDRGEDWRAALSAENLLCAVNQEQVELNHPLAAGDEVAFFPPVTGG